MTDTVYWSLIISGAVALLGAVLLLCWALFADRLKSFRRCPKCWHDMTGSISMTCTECGLTFKRERAFFRRRRRWKWAFGGVILAMIGATTWLTPKIKRDGWTSVVPTTVLILLIPHKRTDLETELLPRLSKPLPVLQQHLLITRCRISAESGTARWANKGTGKYLQQAITFGGLTGSRIDLARGIGMKITLRSRPVWPTDAPLVARINVSENIRGGDTRLHLSTIAELDDRTPIVSEWPGETDAEGRWTDVGIVLGDPVPGTMAIVTETAATGYPGTSKRAGLSVTIAGTIDDLVSPVRRAPLATALSELDWNSGLVERDFVHLPMFELHPVFKELNGVTFAIEVEVLDTTCRILATGIAWWNSEYHGRTRMSTSYHYLSPNDGSRIRLSNPIDPDAAHALRIRGSAEVALRDFDATHYWGGETIVERGDE